MKSILFFLGTAALKRWFVPGINQAFFGSDTSHRLNFPFLTKTLKQYATLAGVGFLAGLFLVAGTSMALFALAQSYEVAGQVMVGAVFYTGLGMALVATATLFGCVRWMKRHKVVQEDIFLREEPAGAYYNDGVEGGRSPGGVVTAILSGFIDGWARARKQRDVPVEIRRAS